MSDKNESIAKFIAERINGGDFYDKKWYNEDQRDLWRRHAEVIREYILYGVDKKNGDPKTPIS